MVKVINSKYEFDLISKYEFDLIKAAKSYLAAHSPSLAVMMDDFKVAKGFPELEVESGISSDDITVTIKPSRPGK